MYQTLKSRLHLNKNTKIRQTAHLGLYYRARRILLRGYRPGIDFGFFNAERYFLLLLVDVQDNDVNFIAEIEHLAGMRQTPCPAHLADMNQTFNPIFKPNKGAVIHHIYYLAFHFGADRITLFHILPGTGCFLLEPK